MNLERLDFVLPEWTRTAWSSATARGIWEPRIRRITSVWEEVERYGVKTGLRRACLQNVSPETLPDYLNWAVAHGLVVAVVDTIAATNSYSASARPAAPGEAVTYRVMLARRSDIQEAVQAFNARDDRRIGEMLGYPECCTEFFQRYWSDENWVDLTLPAAHHSRLREDGDGNNIFVVDGPPECNILLRWTGVRLTSHMPCSFHCDESEQIAIANGRIMAEELDSIHVRRWVYDLLAAPTEWDSLHGIAEIRNPILKVSTRTDALPDRMRVRRLGEVYPEFGAYGTEFPFMLMPEQDRKVVEREMYSWEANGFSSLNAMREAHQVVYDAAFPARPWGAGHFIDLGCGDGALVERIARMHGLLPYGVEIDRARVRLAELRSGTWIQGDIADAPEFMPDGPVILMPGRLQEMTPDRREALVDALRGRHVVAHIYTDWITGEDALRDLCIETGLGWDKRGRVVRGEMCHAAVIVVPKESSHG